jgi:hypothetical protein
LKSKSKKKDWEKSAQGMSAPTSYHEVNFPITIFHGTLVLGALIPWAHFSPTFHGLFYF